jgi:hypothetical protein
MEDGMSLQMKDIELSFETPSSMFGFPLPKIAFKGKLAPNLAIRNFAWGIYVELTTRIILANLEEEQGSLREALDSYHTVFKFVRDQLHSAGPDVGRQGGDHGLPVAASTLWLLNGVFRPLLAEWHPRLARYEESRPAHVGPFAHEANWDQSAAIRKDLESARERTKPFAELFERICDIAPSFIPAPREP